MTYAKAFFELQFHFAETVAALSRLPLERTVLEYTNLYARFGLGRDFDPTHRRWQEYLAGLRDAQDRQEWTYRFYMTRSDPPPPGVVATFGCFSYAWSSGDRIRLHFQDAERDGRSPLAKERCDRRLGELAALFARPRQSCRKPLRVVGASWLYGQVRESLAAGFRGRLQQQSSLQGLDGCFPFQVLSLEAPVREFHDFYGV